MGNLARTAINQNKTIFKAGCSVGNPAQGGKGGLMKCRCHTELDYVKGGSTIVYCPLHAQAEAMLEALKEIKEAADLRMYLTPGSPRPIYNKITAIIANVEGE